MSDTLAGLIARRGADKREISTQRHTLRLADFATLSPFGAQRPRFAGRSVVLAVHDMAKAAAALIDLDGLAARIFLVPPGFAPDHLALAVERLEADALIYEGEAPFAIDLACEVDLSMRPRGPQEAPPRLTEWVLPTSGTSGPPKLAVHTLLTLAGALGPTPHQEWATFYDIRRYGGLQIFLRALAGAGSLRIAGPDEPMDSFLTRLAAFNVTHVSGTPTHWRKALMSGAATRIAPQYVRLSGEIADASALSGLAAAFPRSRVEHAYASTEAGVVFSVADGRAGFPAEWLQRKGDVEMRLTDGALQVRSARRALRLIGQKGLSGPLVDEDGFLDTGDMVETRGDRCYFLGRRGGIINVGGAKVHPEEVEAVLNALPGVRASRVFGMANPIMGALVSAEIVLNQPGDASREREREILVAARAQLPKHMAPARVAFVAELPMTAAGKLRRHG
jgi:acyl-coenzyme A synthetase/AMP-(fatty) acid ligase